MPVGGDKTEKQNRCPRRHIKEDPEWWSNIIGTYNAYDKGFLPARGAMDDQPALFEPIMATMSSAISLEDELAKAKTDRNRPQQAPEGTKPGYAAIKTPRKR